MLLRKEVHPNEFPERSGRRDIYAQRLGSLYRLKFVWYTDSLVYSRLYTISEEKFVSLVLYYGKQVDQSRLTDEYLITGNRTVFRLWAAKCGHKVNLIAVAPNMSQHRVKGNFNKLQKHAESHINWKMEVDQEKNRWLVTQFLIKREYLNVET